MSAPKLQADIAFEVTPHDSNNLTRNGIEMRGCTLYVGTGGHVSVEMLGGDEVAYLNVPSGTFMPINVVRVNSTGTTASNIIAMV